MTFVSPAELKRPLVAILRGIQPHEAHDIGCGLAEAGFEAIEVPLNSPEPFKSIEAMRMVLPDLPLLGAGTVLDADEIDTLARAGGNLMVSPNVDPPVIKAAVAAGMTALPGVFTPTEALAAIKAGASGLKIFPASVLGPAGIAAMRAVMPSGTFLAAVGGVSERDFPDYARNGITAFGMGSSLYKPGLGTKEIAANARAVVEAWDRTFAA